MSPYTHYESDPTPYTLNPIGFFLLINLITSESLDPLQVWPYTLHPEP